eukprot:Opistho-2@81190
MYHCRLTATQLQMDIRFDGKVALVTGAGKGIGREIVRALANGGAKVYAVSRSSADLASLAAEVPGVETIALDLSDVAATEHQLGEITDHIDLLVNNAGVACLQPFLETTVEDFERTMASM